MGWKKHIIISCIGLLPITVLAQQSLKLNKQQTVFFYTQFNLHGGYVHDGLHNRIDFANRSPQNQVAFQLFSKDQNRLQQGYTRFIRPVSWKVRTSLVLDKTVTALGYGQADVDFKLLDTWVKFGTKWDRTSITVGNKSIPYGHNPKLDPVSSFMSNIIKTDLGFAQDVGVFVKTPVSPQHDLELSVTSGGVMSAPLLVCEDLVRSKKDPEAIDPTVAVNELSYEGTWLLTGRVGQPTYKKNEVGLIGVAGYIPSTFIDCDNNHIVRGGVDWVHKHNETFKVVNQVAVGKTISDLQGEFISFNAHSNIDVFIKGTFIISASHTLNMINDPNSDTDFLNGTVGNSFTYRVSPHTRIRLNQYYTYVRNDDATWGVLVQLVTGIGKRP